MFVVRYSRTGNEVATANACLCFDGEALGLTDLYAILGHFIPYQQRYAIEHSINLNEVTVELSEKLNDGDVLWVGYLVCEDHEGETFMAVYSTTLKPEEGMKILHQNMVNRFLKPRSAS